MARQNAEGDLACWFADQNPLLSELGKDIYCVFDAIVKDCNNTKDGRPGKQTAKAVASMAGSLAGGYLGAIGGDAVGTHIGGAIGAQCKEMGA
jgi:uncharacterized membrane protein